MTTIADFNQNWSILLERAFGGLDVAVAPGNESAQFWPAWNEYRAAMAANGDRTLALIKNFAENYETMTDQKADEIMTDHFSIEMQNVVVKQKFAQEIGKFMPAQKVMRLIQIENKLDAAIDLQLAAEIPLAQ